MNIEMSNLLCAIVVIMVIALFMKASKNVLKAIIVIAIIAVIVVKVLPMYI